MPYVSEPTSSCSVTPKSMQREKHSSVAGKENRLCDCMDDHFKNISYLQKCWQQPVVNSGFGISYLYRNYQTLNDACLTSTRPVMQSSRWVALNKAWKGSLLSQHCWYGWWDIQIRGISFFYNCWSPGIYPGMIQWYRGEGRSSDPGTRI